MEFHLQRNERFDLRMASGALDPSGTLCALQVHQTSPSSCAPVLCCRYSTWLRVLLVVVNLKKWFYKWWSWILASPQSRESMGRWAPSISTAGTGIRLRSDMHLSTLLPRRGPQEGKRFGYGDIWRLVILKHWPSRSHDFWDLKPIHYDPRLWIWPKIIGAQSCSNPPKRSMYATIHIYIYKCIYIYIYIYIYLFIYL